MYIKRKLEQKIFDNLKNREYLAIIGPRQAGKTTLMQRIQAKLDNSIYLSFEDRELLALFDHDIKLFAKEYARFKYIFIDEFQYSQNGGQNLKYLYDQHPNFKFIISGSSAIDLTVKALKYLVGRIFIFELYQFDFIEFLTFKNLDLAKLLTQINADISFARGKFILPEISLLKQNELNRLMDEFIIWGAYPRVVLAETPAEKILILKNIYQTYFLRDIRDVAGLIDDYKLIKLIKGLATQTGQMIQYAELGKISAYDYLSLKRYLNILKKTFISRAISPFHRNKQTELVKNPKIYFFDNGLRNSILSNFNSIDSRDDKGAITENYVFTELIKHGLEINYWRTKQKAEVDFVIQAEQQSLLPLEVKNKINQQEISRSFHSFVNVYSPPKAVILNRNFIEKKKINQTEFFFLPFWIIN